MSTGLDVFDNTVQETNRWLNSVAEELGGVDKHTAYGSLRASLHALRDRIPVKAATEFGAQLPMLLRGFYYEGFNPEKTPRTLRSEDEFLAAVEEVFAQSEGPETLMMARASFKTVNKFMTRGQVEQTRDMLNESFRDAVWPAPNV